ncbi:MAG TPA: hypothetical protein VNX86_00900 [Rhizomicrobium sp.]|jgi:hypothetical protein|nr:hypothetical protein [Rhizomicrobium sp.]
MNEPPKTPLEPVAVGIDSLYLSVFIDGIGVDWERLKFEKERLRVSPGEDYAEFEFGGERFALHRGGRKPYSFVLSNRAFTLSLSERLQPRCHAQFSSELLWHERLEEALKRFHAMLANIGTRETRPEVISRVDAAFDFAVGNPEFRTEHFVSDARKDGTWREDGTPQSFQFGKDDVVCRVYDKVAEIEQQSGKDWLFDIWGVREGVWRCEFQIRGPRLKQAGIATIGQLRGYFPGLVRHLAKHHTSLRIPTRDRNRSRWPRHPMWEGLIAAADQLLAAPESPPPPLLTGIEYPLDRQPVSLEGDLKAIAALLSRNCPERPVTLGQLLKWLPRMMRRRHSPELWKADVIAKIRKRELGL